MNPFWELEQYGDSPVLIQPDGTQLGYRELAAMADAIAAQWNRSHSLIFIHCANNVSTLASYLAVLRHGHVALLLPERQDQAITQHLETLYQPQCIVAADGTMHQGCEEAQAMDERVALLLSTSGSTGTPKQVALSRDNLHANATAIASYLELDATERPITTLPFHYSYGLSVINSHLLVGACLLMNNESVVTTGFWDFFRIAEATSLAGVPTTYEMLQRLRLGTMELPSLRTLTQAGGRLAPERVKHFAAMAGEKGWRFFVMYGQTEATARIAYLPAESVAEHPDSIGRAIPGGELHLLDDKSTDIDECGVTGELVYRGPNVMLGYVESRRQLAQLQPLEELHTGDLAYRDESGLFYITGRLKRFIKLHGLRIALDELETLLRERSGVEVLCGGKDQFLLIAHPSTADSRALQQLAGALLGIPNRDIHLLALDSWPVTESGKIAYEQLLELAHAG
jgi:acyl-CoA synthetase (AMP-forming)/AMP-acid ligase II